MSKDKAIADLKALVRSASHEALWEIARHDSYVDAKGHQKHFHAMLELINLYDCEFKARVNMSWYPQEAIELCSHCYEENNPESFAVSTAILLIDDLVYDFMDYMDFRLENLGEETYAALPKIYCEPVLAGIRALDLPPYIRDV